ncbi:MaoC family dehydratase [Acinetobacter guillouiae]|uniref:MaoC family dehydratase n=1 Tax=Acinetobacter guillouiae TaxID=106649 RepID=UPI003AF71DC8
MLFHFERDNGLSNNKVGYQCVYKFQFTENDVIKFAEVTGDNNPIHLDKKHAETTIFKKPIVHGFYVGSVFSRIFGTDYPGVGTIYLHQMMSFLAPVFTNNFYYASVLVKDIDGIKGKATIVTEILDENQSKILIGEAQIKSQIYRNI